MSDIPQENVFFGVAGAKERVAYQYDRRRLRLGVPVFVGRDRDGNPSRFEPEQFDGAEKFHVTWIAPSEWYVILEAEWKISPSFVNAVSDALGSQAHPKVIERACQKAASVIRPKHRYKTSEFERSPLSVIATVVDRLDLATRLSALDVARPLAHHYEPLVTYLMLTCFDRLGQPSEWIDFGAWLRAKESKSAGKIVDESAVKPIDAALALHERWLALYGTRNSFFRFLRELLPANERRQLLDSIDVTRLSMPPEINHFPVNDEWKERWLFDMRNGYTHRAQFIPGIPREPFFLEHLDHDAWMQRTQRFGASEWTNVATKHWPEVLVSTVRAGLAEYIAKLAKSSR